MALDRLRVAGLAGLLLLSSSVALPLVADGCSGVAAYVSGTVYTGGQQAVYNGQLWTAKWWTQNENPSTGGSGVWQYVSDCSGGGGGNTTPAGYTWCANENGSYTFSQTVDVAYGANGVYVYKTGVSGAVTFNNATFGDPISGVAKAGYYKASTSTVGPAGYTWCAAENGSYTFTKAVDVAFGANGAFVYKTGVTGAITFDNATFGDPAFGVAKAGYYKDASNVGPAGYTWCAGENGSYTFNQAADVAYGANGSFAYKTNITGAITFDNATFGDPISGVVKAGYYKNSGGNTTTLPKHILTGYWHNFKNGAQVLRISDVPTTYDLICVSFADATSTPGAVNFTLDGSLGFSEAQFIADIATAKARGQHVIISVGGETGRISVADSASATNFANSINTLMTKYGFEGVDIDLENGLNPTYMAQGLRAIKSGSIITMAPQTADMQSTGGSYFQLALSIKDILTVCNMQYYNSGCMLGYDQFRCWSQGNVDFLTALATIQLEGGLRADQVGLGLPASPSGGGGYVAPSVVNQALGCLANGSNPGAFKPPHTYPAIRGAMTWSINWDASNGYNFANTVSPYLRSMP